MDHLPTSPYPSTGPTIERVMHELKRRTLTVSAVTSITPNMLRITATGEDLADFTSLAPSDHLKILLQAADGTEIRRDYTPRRFDRATRTLDIDFALHEAGPATLWAMNARPGDTLSIGGPRGSALFPESIKRWLLIGDETALPAIGRRIEESAADVTITALITITGAAEKQAFETNATLDLRWVYRPAEQAADPAALLAAVQTLDIAPSTFIWIAAEGAVTRALRSYFADQRGVPLAWMRAAGYWVKGKADTVENF